MKRIFLTLALAFCAAFFVAEQAEAQCNASQYAQDCIGKLGDGYTFLKSFQIDGQGGGKPKVEYSYVFSKDTQYTIRICTDGSDTDGIKVTLYDANRQKKR